MREKVIYDIKIIELIHGNSTTKNPILLENTQHTNSKRDVKVIIFLFFFLVICGIVTVSWYHKIGSSNCINIIFGGPLLAYSSTKEEFEEDIKMNAQPEQEL